LVSGHLGGFLSAPFLWNGDDCGHNTGFFI